MVKMQNSNFVCLSIFKLSYKIFFLHGDIYLLSYVFSYAKNLKIWSVNS